MPRKPVAATALSGLELVEAQVLERHLRHQQAGQAIAKSLSHVSYTLLEEFQQRVPLDIADSFDCEFVNQVAALRAKLIALGCSLEDVLALTGELADSAYLMTGNHVELAWYTAWASARSLAGADLKGGA